MTTREYEAKDGGGKRRTTEIVAQWVEFLDPRSSTSSQTERSASRGFDDSPPEFDSGPDTPPPVDE